jgi:hypothetical protein
VPWEYVPPAGIARTGSSEPGLEERYEVQWRDDEEPPHYFYWAQVSALRLVRLVEESFALLPDRVRVVLEVRRTDEEMDRDPDGPSQARWSSGAVSRDRLLTVWREHGAALVHDGTVGFGAYDPDSPLEVFLDDHKLLSLFAPETEPFESLLRRHGVEEGRSFPTLLDTDHHHLALAAVRGRDAASRRAWGRRKGLDVAVFAPAIRRSLRMRRQQATPAE